MAYKVEITHSAEADAQEYASYIVDEQQSPAAASKWLDGLTDVLTSLQELPNRFPVISESGLLGFPYRSTTFHSHRIIYAVHEENKRVVIHRIYHGARRPLEESDFSDA